jgi:hypothetical protein
MIHKWLYSGLAVLVLGLLYLAHAYSVRQARAEEQQTATGKLIAAKDQALADRDKQFSDFKAQMLQQIADIKTAKQATQVLAPIIVPQGGTAPQTVTKADLPPEVAKTLPGPANASFTLLSEEQMVNLGKREINCRIAEAGVSKCDQDKRDMQEKISKLTEANQAWEKAGAVPRWTAGLGVARAGGNAGYTPVTWIDYRIQPKWGLFAGAENRAVFAGVSINFGATPK